MSTLSILATLLCAFQTPPAPKPSSDASTRTYFEYRDGARGMTLILDDGRVTLTVPSDQGKTSAAEPRTYKAKSIEEFNRLYPDVARKYQLDECRTWNFKPDSLRSWWHDGAGFKPGDEPESLGSYFREFPKELADQQELMDRWFEDQHRILRDLERRLHEEPSKRPAPAVKSRTPLLGVKIGPLDEALRTQLGLKPQEGLLIAEVEKGSLADTAGLLRYDVLMKISGQEIQDVEKFHAQLGAALPSKEFVLDVIRGGKPLKIVVHPAHS